MQFQRNTFGKIEEEKCPFPQSCCLIDSHENPKIPYNGLNFSAPIPYDLYNSDFASDKIERINQSNPVRSPAKLNSLETLQDARGQMQDYFNTPSDQDVHHFIMKSTPNLREIKNETTPYTVNNSQYSGSDLSQSEITSRFSNNVPYASKFGEIQAIKSNVAGKHYPDTVQFDDFEAFLRRKSSINITELRVVHDSEFVYGVECFYAVDGLLVSGGLH